MWLFSYAVENVKNWAYPKPKPNREVRIYPRGTKSNDHILIEFKDCEAEQIKARRVELVLFLSELLAVSELRSFIMSFLLENERNEFCQSLDKSMDMMEPYIPIDNFMKPIWRKYIAYMKRVLTNVAGEFYEPPTNERDHYKEDALLLATFVLPPLLLAPMRLDVTIMGHNSMDSCSSLVVSLIDIISPKSITHTRRDRHEVHLVNGNRALFGNYTLLKDDTRPMF